MNRFSYYMLGAGDTIQDAIYRLQCNVRGRLKLTKFPDFEIRLSKYYLHLNELYYPLSIFIAKSQDEDSYFIIEVDFKHVLSTAEIKKLE